MAQCCKEIKETVQMLASRHKDIHGSVSKVGKAIDRVSEPSFFFFFSFFFLFVFVVYFFLVIYVLSFLLCNAALLFAEL